MCYPIAKRALVLFMVLPAGMAWSLDPTLPRPTGAPALASSSTSPTSAPAVVADSTPVQPVAINRAGVPDAKAQQEALKLVEQIYKDELAAARTADQKKQLAAKFRQLASETAGDTAGQFVLLSRTRELAADAGDIDTALGAAADLERAFQIDVTPQELDAVTRLQRVLRSTEGYRSLARYLLGSANQAIATDHLESAIKLIDQAVAVAARGNDAAQLRLITARAKEIREIQADFNSAKSSLDKTAKSQDDPEQNLIAGRHKALFRGDFATGLPLLAAGANPALKEVAAKELAGVSGTDQLNAMGDAWWDAAGSLSGVAKNVALVHASRYYAQAEPGLTGLQKAKASKRVKEIEPLAAMHVGRPSGASKSPVPSGEVAAKPPAAKPPATGSTTPPVTINLPPKFSRVWKTPESWQNKPEQVTLAGGRVTILNEGGTNTVCENEPLTPQKDGTLVLTWNYGPDKTGYEVWTLKGGQLLINRWQDKAEADNGRPARRTGMMASN